MTHFPVGIDEMAVYVPPFALSFEALAGIRDHKRIYERGGAWDVMPARSSDLDAAYRHCRQIAAAHYENFTVGSWLLPRRLRRHIAAIYAFARAADDFADEGDLSAAQRLARLDDWQCRLEDAYAGRPSGPIFVALADTAAKFDIPSSRSSKLLRAFRADVEFRGFATSAELLDYCRCSADPVGHLILYLFGYRDAGRQQLADKVCTGLQLANFWQDLSVDAQKGRIYVPRRGPGALRLLRRRYRRGRDARRSCAGSSASRWRAAASLLLEGRDLAGLVESPPRPRDAPVRRRRLGDPRQASNARTTTSFRGGRRCPAATSWR